MDKNQEFLKKLLETFRIEADEGVKKMSANLVKLEKKPSESESTELIEIIFREAHSLKGASRAVNLIEIESVCQAFESVMSVLKNKIIELNPDIFDVLHQGVDIINEILNSLETGINYEIKKRINKVILNLASINKEQPKKNKVSAQNPNDSIPDLKRIKEEKVETIKSIENESFDNKKMSQVSELTKTSTETIRVSTQKLDNLLFQTEEMLSLKLSSIQQTENLKLTLDKINIWKKEASNVFISVRNMKQKLEKREKEGVLSNDEKEIIKMIQFSEWSVSHIRAMEDELIESRKFAVQEAYDSGAKIESLLEDVKDIITVPFSLIMDAFPKFVRDISKDVGKDIDFIISGEETAIDRRILESIRNPLIHIIRNCVDYGIEKPDVRLEKNKSIQGTLKITIERLENSKISIEISDDGAGVNIERLRNLYIKNEKVTVEDASKIQDTELLNYIFKSGITTSEIVTDISGRGLGLAIVQEKIDQLGGNITLDSEKDKGTCFKIEIPLTLVTFRGVLIKVSGSEFVLPTAKIQRVLRINKKDVKTIENKATIPFDDRFIPMINLGEILELPQKENDTDYVQVIILGSDHEKTGFVINEIIDEQEVLVKNFNKHMVRLKNITGATVLGSGKVVPILNTYDLLKSALKPGAANIRQSVISETETMQKTVLVVEDSITSRTLLKNILESAGYSVTTAIDGIDGFTKLKENLFNAVVSDIEMPRMNGFDLTSKIRADKDLSEIPILLVTSLSKTEDKEKGIEVGANAYIIKSSFDQSNLLEILERLI